MSIPTTSLDEAKAVCAMCPESTWLSPSSKMDVQNPVWELMVGQHGFPMVQYGHLVILCSE